MQSFKQLADAELVGALKARERDLVAARFKHSTGQLENTAKVGVIRRDIARMRTELRARELGQGLAKDALLAAHRNVASAPAESLSTGARGGFLQGIVDKISGNE